MAGPKQNSGSKHRKNKGKRWKKGHSSSSNPETKKHRLQAKNRFFHQNQANSSLTVSALEKHDASENDTGNDKGVGSVSGSRASYSYSTASTFKTWASNWTECTNTTFGRVHRYWSSNSAMHKEVLAILAAVTEVIKTNGGKETETEYFAALMTTLDTTEEDESKAAVAYLLSLVIKKVPEAVLKKRFSEVAQNLFNHLATHANSDSTSLLKSLISCLATVLRVQDRGTWNDASTLQLFNGILSFTEHAKPKVRKTAQEAVTSVLRGSHFMIKSDAPPHHPAASTTAKHCIQKVEEAGGSGEATLYILHLLKDILGVFPQHSLKSTCEAILRLMTLSNVIVTSVAMQALHGMFAMEPKANCLSAELNAQVITALYDYQPGENDIQPMAAWLAVMEKAHTNLFRLDEKRSVSHLPRLFNVCMKCLLAEKIENTQAASTTMILMLRECIEPAVTWVVSVVQAASKDQSSPIHRMFRVVESGLSYQYHASWALVLDVLAVFFEVIGKGCHAIMKKCLVSLSDLRDSHRFPYKAVLDHAVGVAVKTMGPRVVLTAVPLGITGEDDNYDFPRSWLLPVLRDNIQDTELAFFTGYFLPLAAKLRMKSVEYEKEGRVVESKTYDALQLQIWSLLPRFCIRPIDLLQSFKGMAKILGSAISDRPDLRMDVMASLRKLILHNVENVENRVELAKYAKNYLPILLNVYTTDPERQKDPTRLAAFETIKVYFQITDTQLLSSIFDKVVGKMTDIDVNSFKRHALMDLLIAMVPYVEKQKLKLLYDKAVPQLESLDRTVQKKCYRILETICESKSDSSQQFVQEYLSELQQVLLQSLSSSGPSAKAPRLRCLIYIFKQLASNQQAFLVAVVPEAILCTKEAAVKARAASYLLLNEMCAALTRWSNQTEQECIFEFFQLVMAGLAGGPHMITTTVFALTSLLHHHKDKVSTELLSSLVQNMCLLLTSKSREIVQAALSFLKVLIGSFPDTTLAKHLQQLVASLISMKEESRHHFRFKAKEIFVRLIRKFGYETIHGMVPESYHKMLVNIRKTQERSKRKRKERANEVDDDEDIGFKAKAQPESIDELLRDTDSELEGEEEDKKPTKQKLKTKKGSAWLKEESEDIVDFLDPSVAKKVLATKPIEKLGVDFKKRENHGFKMAADGRFIITEGEEDKPAKKGKKADIDDLGVDELMEAMDHYSKKSRKRKMSNKEADPDESPAKYQAGGSGIHRPIATGKRKKQPEANYGSEYKSKKASGDVKKQGKADPYAYVPLSFQNLNKRKQAKTKGQFSNLVRGAKRGAKSGQKAKARKAKHK